MKIPMQGIAVTFLVFLGFGCSDGNQASRVFVTEYGTGPDKWATAWLLTRYLHPGASLELAPSSVPATQRTEFDTPGAAIRRTGDRSAFETALSNHEINDPAIEQLRRIIHDIEVNFWAGNRVPEAQVVDGAFRVLHRQQAQGVGRQECFLAFFDSVYQALSEKRGDENLLDPQTIMVDCQTTPAIGSDEEKLVSEVSITQILARMGQGKSVTFVDVREPGEFLEAHIPGAFNITLRDVSGSTIAPLQGADYVVSYCVKDFRGFEMAKKLKEMGIENSVILNPYGIKGWIAEGLPVVGRRGLSRQEGEKWLRACELNDDSCMQAVSS